MRYFTTETYRVYDDLPLSVREIIGEVRLGDITVFMQQGRRLPFDAEEIALALGVRCYATGISVGDPALHGLVVMQRPLLTLPGQRRYVGVRIGSSPNANHAAVHAMLDVLRSVLDTDAPVLTLFSAAQGPAYDYDVAAERNVCGCSPQCDMAMPGRIRFDLTPAPRASVVNEYAEEEHIADVRKEWEDRLSGLILDYVMRFRQMPPIDRIQTMVRGKLMLGMPGTLSSITVNADLRVVLPEFNEIELRMTPLARALYILFLCHPHGIVLKDIGDFQTQLRDIYLFVKPGADSERADLAVAELCDPLGDSLRQKLSMVKRAVNRYIVAPDIAAQYTITGRRGGAYSIPAASEVTVRLPRALRPSPLNH